MLIIRQIWFCLMLFLPPPLPARSLLSLTPTVSGRHHFPHLFTPSFSWYICFTVILFSPSFLSDVCLSAPFVLKAVDHWSHWGVGINLKWPFPYLTAQQQILQRPTGLGSPPPTRYCMTPLPCPHTSPCQTSTSVPHLICVFTFILFLSSSLPVVCL